MDICEPKLVIENYDYFMNTRVDFKAGLKKIKSDLKFKFSVCHIACVF